MKRLNRPMKQEDLTSKGYPLECMNCGNKPTPRQVIQYGGDCEICGDTIVAYVIDTAEMIINMKKFESSVSLPVPIKTIETIIEDLEALQISQREFQWLAPDITGRIMFEQTKRNIETLRNILSQNIK